MKSLSLDNYKPVLIECFRRDESLLSKWHIFAGKGLDACVDKTFKDLTDSHVTFFSVYTLGELAGYFCRENYGEQEFLTGFFLMPEFRDHDTREHFWSHVKMRFGSKFFCGLYEKNIPARKFIEKRGGRFVRTVEITDGVAVLYELGA